MSVLLPARDASAWITGALESVLQQSLGELEVVVVDDASTDDTADLVRAAQDPRVVLVSHERPLGVAAALRTAARASRAPYLARQDADDRSHAGRLEVLLERMRSDERVAVVGSAARAVAVDGAPRGIIPVQVGPAHVARALYLRTPLVHGTALIRASALDAVGGYRDVPAEDYDLWSRLHLQGWWMTNVGEVLYDYRVHSGAVSERRAAALARSARDIRDRLWSAGCPWTSRGAAPEALPRVAHRDLLVRTRAVQAVRLAAAEARRGHREHALASTPAAVAALVSAGVALAARPAPLRRSRHPRPG